MESFFELSQIIREIRNKATNALLALQEKKSEIASTTQEYLKRDLSSLKQSWPKRLKSKNLDNLSRHIYYGQIHDYKDMLKNDIPGVETDFEKYFRRKLKESGETPFKELLHPVVVDSSYKQFLNRLLRDAVLNAVVAVFDYIRARTESKLDGQNLIEEVLAPSHARLILSELKTESGKNDQLGFMNIFKGTYQGIRNPKAHTLQHDLTKSKASQYLVFLSLLARRVEEAKNVKTPKEEK